MFLLWLLIGMAIGTTVTKLQVRKKLQKIIKSEEIGITDKEGNFITGEDLLKILG